MQISPDKIAEILERTDIVELVSRNVKLRRSGGNYIGLCPFHAERTGSFNVNPQRRMFKCFGCDASGDAITFVQKINGIGFMDAVRQLAKEAGVDLEERHDPQAELRTRLFSAAATAQRIFENCLWNDPSGQPGREHLRKRGVSQESAKIFGLGYAPPSWNFLTNILRQEGSLEWAHQIGLVGKRRSGDGYFDTFRGRLIIPIRSPEGRNIAFGGRLIESMPSSADVKADGGKPKEPKYLNTKESFLYKKFDTLYGLDAARDGIRKSKSAVVVEGYFDVIGLYAAGIRNAVALCSTALTSGHLSILDKNGAQSILMLLDGDAAGFGAVRRLAGSLLASGKTIRVAALPDGVDPDEYALRAGPEGLNSFLENAPTLSRHLLTSLLPHGYAHPIEEKISALKNFREILREMPAGLAKSAFIGDIAAHIGVQETEVRGFLREDPKNFIRRDPARVEMRHPRVNEQETAERANSGKKYTLSPMEAMTAALLLEDKTLLQELNTEEIAQIRSVELRLLIESGLTSGGDFFAALDEETAKSIAQSRQIVIDTLTKRDDRLKALRDTMRRIHLQTVESDLAEARKQLLAALDSGADEEDIECLQENHRRLNAERLNLMQPI